MRRAIALSGGGTKGAYELGAWKALRKLGVDYQIVTGTSIGSINGALMVTGDYDRAEELWNTITIADMMEDGINLTATIEGMYDQREAIRPFLKKYVRNKGADISPFTSFIETLIDEEAVRASKVDFGLVTVLFPSLTAKELTKKEIPEGMLKDYILASAAIFPLFPMHKIGEQMYLDGCYHDNLPIDLALRMGATDVIAVDLHTTPAHANYAKRPYVTYIKPSRPLGTMMNFDRMLLMENAQMGYCDTMKVFGEYWGYDYTFDRPSIGKCKKSVNKFIAYLVKTDLYLMEDTPAKKLGINGDFNRVFAILNEKAGKERLSKEQCFVLAGELCGRFFGVDVRPVYEMQEYIRQLQDELKGIAAYPEIKGLAESENLEFAKRLAEMKLKQKSRYITGCIYYLLQLRPENLKRLLRACLTLLPEELAAALFLHATAEKNLQVQGTK